MRGNGGAQDSEADLRQTPGTRREHDAGPPRTVRLNREAGATADPESERCCSGLNVCCHHPNIHMPKPQHLDVMTWRWGPWG